MMSLIKIVRGKAPRLLLNYVVVNDTGDLTMEVVAAC